LTLHYITGRSITSLTKDALRVHTSHKRSFIAGWTTATLYWLQHSQCRILWSFSG